jgi:hypothetical protein
MINPYVQGFMESDPARKALIPNNTNARWPPGPDGPELPRQYQCRLAA